LWDFFEIGRILLWSGRRSRLTSGRPGRRLLRLHPDAGVHLLLELVLRLACAHGHKSETSAKGAASPPHGRIERGRDDVMLEDREGVPKGVAQYLALTMLRTQSESSMAPMMTPLLTRRGSCRLRSDGFISPSSSSRRSRRLPAGAPTRPRSGAPRPKRPPFAAPSDLLLSLRSRRRKGGRASWHRQGMGTGARTRKEGSRCFA